jgi:hypothetical protein
MQVMELECWKRGYLNGLSEAVIDQELYWQQSLLDVYWFCLYRLHGHSVFEH